MLRLIVCVTGAAILALELVASRYLSPSFGASIYIWGAILAVTLLALALGYRLGGRLADRAADPARCLLWMVVGSALWIACLPPLGADVLHLAVQWGPRTGPLAAMLTLFAAPLGALATATPLAFGALIRADGDCPGQKIGDLFALSTAGSIVGALLAAYVAIPVLGLRLSLFGTSAVLLLLAVLGCPWRRWRDAAGYAAALVALGVALAAPAPGSALNAPFAFLDRSTSPYGQIDVITDLSDGGRILVIDGASQNHVVGDELDHSVFFYVNALREQVRRFDFSRRRALVLGLGAGTLPRLLVGDGFQVTVVEIDPGVVAAAQAHFRFDIGAVELLVADARPALRQLAAKARAFELVVLDVAGSGTQPAHLFTREAFQEIDALMAPDGVLMANLIGPLAAPHDRLQRHVAATVASVFAVTEAIQLQPNLDSVDDIANLLLLGSHRAPARPPRQLAGERRLPVERDLVPLTDDRNPAALWSIWTNAQWHRNVQAWLGSGVAVPQ